MSLANCFSKSSFSKEEQQFIEEKSLALQKEGYSIEQAEQMAITSLQKEIEESFNDVYKQLGLPTTKTNILEANLAFGGNKYKAIGDPFTIERNVNFINFQFFNTLSKYKEKNNLQDYNDIDTLLNIDSNPDTAIYNIYAAVYNGLVKKTQELSTSNPEKADKLYNIIDQFFTTDEEGNVTGRGDYYMLALRDLANYGLQIKTNGSLSIAYDTDMDSSELVNEDEKDQTRQYEVTALQLDPKQTLKYEVKKLLKQTLAYKLTDKGFELAEDEFGFYKFIDFDNIYNTLEQELSGIYDIDEMMDQLNELAGKKHEVYGIILKLEENPTLRTQFFTSLPKQEVNFINIRQDINRRYNSYVDLHETVVDFKIYNANRTRSYQLLIDKWYNNLVSPNSNSITDKEGNIDKEKAREQLAKYNSFLEGLKKSREVTFKDNERLSNLLQNFGIEISPEVLQYHFRNITKRVPGKNKKIELTAYENYINLLEGSPSIRTILNSIVSGNNPYKGEETETTSLITVAKSIARYEDNLHQAVVNIGGKNYYSYNLPTFLSKKFDELKKEEGIDSYLSNWWFKRNKWLQDLRENSNLRDKFNFFSLGELRLNNEDHGTVFFNMTDTKLDISDINMFWNNESDFAYYRTPILSDSAQSPYIFFKKYNDIEVIDALYQLALSEKDRIDLVNSTDINIKSYIKNGKSYQFLPFLNNRDFDINDEEGTKKIIKEWLDEELAIERQRLIDNKVLNSKGLFEKNIATKVKNRNTLLQRYFYNKVLANAMITQLTSVDLAAYKDYGDFQKRNGQIFKFTQMLDTKAIWGDTSTGTSYSTIYLQDEKFTNKYLGDLVWELLQENGYSEQEARTKSALFDAENKPINQTDGFSYYTLDRYKKIKIGYGEWNDKYEQAYKKAKAGVAWDKDYEIFFEGIKPFHFQHENIQGTSFIIPVQHKNAEFPLLPALAKQSSELKFLLNYMEEKKIDTVLFESAVKTGLYGQVSFSDLRNSKATPIIHSMDNKYWGIQQATPQHFQDTDNLIGTQAKKLIFGDIPDKAKFFGNKYSKKELFDIYQKLLIANAQEGFDNISEEFNNFKELQKLILDQVIQRNLGSYFEDQFKIIDGKFNLPPFHPGTAKKVEPIFSSLIRKEVTKQKINGSALPLFSSFGFSDKLKVVINPDTKALEHYEVMLPWWTKESFPTDSKGNVDFDLIKKQAPELLDLIGFRIPTEHKYSMKKLRVVGFTPQMMGGVAILPKEITTIAGEDFDIDKMYVMIPNHEYKNGKLQKTKYDLSKLFDYNILKLQDFKTKIGNIGGNLKESQEILLKEVDTLTEDINELEIIGATIEGLFKISNSNPYIDGYNLKVFTDYMNYEFKDYQTPKKIRDTIAKYQQFFEHAFILHKLAYLAEKEGKSELPDNLTELAEKQKLTKEQRDNAIIDIFGEILSHPDIAVQNLNPGGFEELKRIAGMAESMYGVQHLENPILPRTQMKYFETNTNGAGLIGIAANANTNRSILQYTNISFIPEFTFNFDGHKETNLSKVNNFKGTLISRDGSEFLAAFVDNSKTPVAGILNLSPYTFEVVNSIVALGYGLETAMAFINQPVIRELSKIYHREGETKSAEKTAYNEVFKTLNSKTKEKVLNTIYPFNTQSLLLDWNRLPLDKMSELEAIQQLKVLQTFKKYKEAGSSLSKLINATKVDVNGVGQNMATTQASLQNITAVLEDTNLVNTHDLLRGGDYPIISRSNELLEKSQSELLGKFFPYDNEGYTNLYSTLASKKGSQLSVDEINYINNFSVGYYISGFDYFHQETGKKTKEEFVTTFPEHFFKMVKEHNLFDYELVKFLKFTKAGINTPIDLIEFTSNIQISNNQRDKIKRSWEGMMQSENAQVRKLADDLAKYSFYTTAFLYKFQGISHFIPTSYFERITNSTGVTYRNYLYKLMEDSKIDIFESLIDQIYRNKEQLSLLRTLKGEDVTNGIVTKGRTTSIIIDKAKMQFNDMLDNNDQVKVDWFKTFAKNGDVNIYKYAGTNELGDSIFHIQEPLGTNFITEVDFNNSKLSSLLPINRFSYNEKAYYPTTGKPEVFNSLENDEDFEEVNNKVKEVLEQRLTEWGIKLEYFRDFEKRLSNNAIAAADITNKIIRVSKDREDKDTLPEEVGHFVEAYNRGTEFHDRLMELITSTPEYRQEKEKYMEVYGDETKVRQEVIGQLLGKGFIKGIENKSSLGITDLISRLFQRLWTNFKNFFKSKDQVALQSEIDQIIGKISRDVISGDLKLDTNVKVNGKFYRLNTKEEERSKEILEKGIDSIYKKLKIYSGTGSEEFKNKREQLLAGLKDKFNKKNYELGLTNYIINAKEELQKVAARFENIEKKTYDKLEDKRDILSTLSHINEYVRGFAPTLEEISKTDIFNNTPTRTNLLETIDLINQLHGQYHKIGSKILTDILKVYNSNKDLDVSKAIATLDKDISWFQQWLDAMAEASDPVLQILDVITKDHKQTARVKTLDFRHEILSLQKKLEDKGVHNTSFVAERGWNGLPTGRYVTKYNIGEYENQKKAFYDGLNRKYPKDKKLTAKEEKARSKEIRKWYEENSQVREDAKAFTEMKKAEFKSKFSPQVAEEKFQDWVNKNTSINEYTGETYLKGEFTIPSNKYLSSQYQEIQANEAMKEYLNFITNHIESNDFNVEEKFRLNGFLPQVKKDFQDRLFVYDKDGKKKLKGIKGIAEESKGSINDAFRLHENDNEFGLTDEEGNPLNLVPLYFTKKLKDPNQVSLDITSAMTAYMYSFNDYIELNKVLGVLKYAKDAFVEREVLTGTVDPITLVSSKFIKNKKGEDIRVKDTTTKGIESRAYQRLESYLEMNFYGRQSAKEEFGKIADLLNTFTSLNSLALNLYTGVSNVLTGNAMIRMETVAGEFMNKEDYFWANNEYTRLLPQTLANIGQRLPDDKLSLWNDRMDTFQNYERDYRDIEADRNTLFGRLLQTSSLYFINHAGEHMLQSRLSLALAHNTKVKDLLGKELTLWDAFDVEEGKLVLQKGLKKVGGTTATSLFTKEEDGQDLTERDINRFINRQNSINKALNGIYNNVDKSAAQQFALFRLGVMFRKYIKPGWNRRFQKKAWNYEGEFYREGYYTTMINFFKNMKKEMKEGQYSLGKHWKNLTPEEKANFSRLATEWTYVISTAVLFSVLEAWADDDDDNAYLSFAAYEAARLYSEMRFYTSLGEAQRIAKSPAASITNLERVIRFGEVWNWGDELQTGKFKGYTHFERDIIQITPLVGTYFNFKSPEEQLKYYSNNGLSLL